MSFEAADQPQDLPCGVIDQSWLDQLNSFRSKTFECVLDLQSSVEGLIQDLPDLFCSYLAPRIFVGESAQVNTASVTLPAGGTWLTHVTVLGTEAPNLGYFTNGITLIDSDDDMRLATGARAYAGGTTLSAIAENSSEEITMSVMAIRVDC